MKRIRGKNKLFERTCCSKGHEYTADNVYYAPRKHAVGTQGTGVARICKVCRAESHDKYRRANLKKVSKKESRLSAKRMRECWIKILSEFNNECQCCGETRQSFLTLDHINGDGADHRRRQNNMYVAVVREGIPRDRYRVLCMNCNWALRHGNKCPHEMERELRMTQIDLEYVEEFVNG